MNSEVDLIMELAKVLEDSIRESVFTFTVQIVDKGKVDIVALSAVFNAVGVPTWITMDEQEAIKTAKIVKPHVIFFDLAWFEIDVLRKLKEVSPRTKILSTCGLTGKSIPMIEEAGAQPMADKYKMAWFVQRLLTGNCSKEELDLSKCQK